MASTQPGEQQLTDFLQANTSSIIEDWVGMTRPQLSSQPPRQLSFEQFRDDVPDALAKLVDYLEHRRGAEASSDFLEVASHHGHQRWRQGFNLNDLIRDWGMLQRVVLKWVNRFYESEAGTETMERSTAVNLVADFFTEAVCGSVTRFDELRREEAARMGRELERMRYHFDRMNDFRERVLKDLSHDIRSPLTAISGASCILKSEANEKDHGDLDEVGAIIDESVTDATSLLDSLQDLSQIDAGLAKLSPSRIDVVGLLREVLDERQASSDDASGSGGVAVTGPERLEVEADPSKLRKTIEGLLQFVHSGRSGDKTKAGVRRIEVRSTPDEWELQLRYTVPDPAQSSEREAAREDMNALVLRRLCLVQFASFKSETEKGGEQLLSLKFPVRYDAAESGGDSH